MSFRLIYRYTTGGDRCEDGLSRGECERLVRVLAGDGFVRQLAYLAVVVLPARATAWDWRPEHGPIDWKGCELALAMLERGAVRLPGDAAERFGHECAASMARLAGSRERLHHPCCVAVETTTDTAPAA